MKRVTLRLSDDAQLAYMRYLSVRASTDEAGEATHREREELRSYAAELVSRLLADNPEVFPEHAAHVAAMARRERERGQR